MQDEPGLQRIIQEELKENLDLPVEVTRPIFCTSDSEILHHSLGL